MATRLRRRRRLGLERRVGRLTAFDEISIDDSLGYPRQWKVRQSSPHIAVGVTDLQASWQNHIQRRARDDSQLSGAGNGIGESITRHTRSHPALDNLRQRFVAHRVSGRGISDNGCWGQSREFGAKLPQFCVPSLTLWARRHQRHTASASGHYANNRCCRRFLRYGPHRLNLGGHLARDASSASAILAVWFGKNVRGRTRDLPEYVIVSDTGVAWRNRASAIEIWRRGAA